MKGIYVVELRRKDAGGYFAAVPDVPGCVTSGKDLADAVAMVRDAVSGCLCVLEDERQPFPVPHLPEEFPQQEGVTYALVDVDTAKYRMQTDTHAVRKNVSIPAWMAEMADTQGVNCSQVLQEALRLKLNVQ